MTFQYYIMKLKSSKLKKLKYNIDIKFDDGKENEEIVALADNQILRSIRDIRKKNVSQNEIRNLIHLKNKLKRNLKSIDDYKELKIIQDKINKISFIPDYITVEIERVSHYKHIFENGIIVNGKLYKRLSCSASQARVSTVVLCNVEIIDELKRRLNNGRNENIKFSPSKFNAYFGLYGSSTHLVSEPKFVVVKDYENQATFMSNFVTETAYDIDDIIEEKEITIDMNRTDGMGLISPRLAKIWGEDLGLDYTPSQFCIRQSFIKGMVCVFDIHEFCKEKNNNDFIIETIYKDDKGEYIKVDIRDYDLILTESQFKLWDSYKSLDQYINLCHENKLYWGVTQFTPKNAKDVLKLNYQFIQTLNLSKEDVEKLCSQFTNWIQGVTYDNIGYTLLYLLGANKSEDDIYNFLESSNNYWLKSLIFNHELKNDKYINNKIFNLIKNQIKNGCLGNIYVDGNFQVLVSDPYAFMEHVCKLPVKGLLKDGEFYSNYWNKKGINLINGMRSPLTYRCEHVVMDLKNDDEVNKWYKYCELGIILNYHGYECVRFGGADFD